MQFTNEEKEILSQYVTDPVGDVFAVKSWAMPGMVGAAYARYSRAQGGFRETLLKEFISEGKINAAHADELIERVLIAFGDDSVGELEGAHLSLENISILATKEIEDRRIGGSPIEQSTRYVFYDQKDSNGNYKYYTPRSIKESNLDDFYASSMDGIFSIYSSLVEPMQTYYRNLKPIEAAEYDINGDGVKERLNDLANEGDKKSFQRTYKSDIRTKACDTLRNLLPIATRTNMGIFGNGRFYQGMLSHLFSAELPEANEIAGKVREALEKVIPAYIKRACVQEYRKVNSDKMAALTAELTRDLKPDREVKITLLDRGEEEVWRHLGNKPTKSKLRQAMEGAADTLILAAMLYPYTEHSLVQLRELVANLPASTREKIFATYVGKRKTRRDRPGRAFEIEYPYVFDAVVDFGTYKDLERHRINTQLRQRFTTKLGFAFPVDLMAAKLEKEAQEAINLADELYHKLEAEFPVEAQYAVLHGHYVRWVLGINDRALQHMVELRTGPQGHPNYRKACQAMYRLIEKRNPRRAQVMKFADFGDYQWARADSEARQRVKEKECDTKFGDGSQLP